MIPRELIENRIRNFWGFGTLKSEVWFVGLEEALSAEERITDDERVITERFQETFDKDVIDLRSIKSSSQDFRNSKKVQNTLALAYRVMLFWRGEKKVEKNDLLKYQKEDFGHSDKNHASLDLMPLPNQKTSTWLSAYSNSGIDYLESRRKYTKVVRPKRIEQLHELIKKYEPKAVILYAYSFKNLDWEKFSVPKPIPHPQMPRVLHTIIGKTHFFITPHTNARKELHLSGDEWNEVARIIQEIAK